MKKLLHAAALLAAVVSVASAPACASAQLTPQGGTGMVYELRTYTAHPGKLEDLERRFRDHTMRLFERHGMRNIGYWVPDDPERSGNTLIYIIAHADRETAARNWAAFRADPEWVEARTASEAAGPVVQRVESVFMYATDYSPIR